MKKNTLEEIEKNYKEAIRSKFRVERVEGKHSHYLNNPSQALLRDLCWEIFSSDPKTDDLSVYRNFFRTEFTREENTSTPYTNKFKKVGGFYRGDIDPANISTVELAAILVDFHPRPFNKFKKEIGEEEMKLINELRNTDFSAKDVPVDELKEETELKNVTDFNMPFAAKEPEPVENKEPEQKTTSTSIQPMVSLVDKPKGNKFKYIAIALVLVLLAAIVFLALPEKQCMQWSNDHYEIVDCDLKIEGLGIAPRIELLDKSLVHLKKVNVSDTTTYFDKNGKAIIWYAKTANGIDFFNGHGRHPENNNALKPVTPYILKKYVKK
ncbi:hypothetical protein [Flavobacterium sp. YO12]|uniref:hypothetical protein n=1 Tax=Flavobacterium sp. YO12 TaxID=1920029 RepID=UPI00100B7378|nr:hypothetical protein [Flavobacterium sp. YO12]RXM49185.1 hypothetical protein BOW55_02250 [Flavobacterium sp. YO12]